MSDKPKRTPKEWVFDQYADVVLDQQGIYIADFGDVEDAEHAVVCVNALEGIRKPAAVKELIEAMQEIAEGDSSPIDSQATRIAKHALAALEMEAA